MKIDVRHILKDHLATLYSARTGKISYWDIGLFYLLPIAASLTFFFLKLTLSKDVYNLSITFFGIFIALLLNIQVAIFAIFQRKWNTPADKRLAMKQAKKLELRRKLMMEINVNISYLVLVCCVSLVFLFISFVCNWSAWMAPAFVIFLYFHFLLTLVMIVKRSHALFHREYLDP